MPSSTGKPSDKLFYSESLGNHIDRISKAGEHLFDITSDADNNSQLPTSTSRLRSFWAQIQLFESFLWPLLSDFYFKETKTPKIILKKWALDKEALFDETQIVLQCLMMECQNNDLLFRHFVDEADELEEED